MSDAINDCACCDIPVRTLWITDRSAMIAATPMAMQMKKNSNRRHDDRISRSAMRMMNACAP